MESFQTDSSCCSPCCHVSCGNCNAPSCKWCVSRPEPATTEDLDPFTVVHVDIQSVDQTNRGVCWLALHIIAAMDPLCCAQTPLCQSAGQALCSAIVTWVLHRPTTLLIVYTDTRAVSAPRAASGDYGTSTAQSVSSLEVSRRNSGEDARATASIREFGAALCKRLSTCNLRPAGHLQSTRP